MRQYEMLNLETGDAFIGSEKKVTEQLREWTEQQDYKNKEQGVWLGIRIRQIYFPG